MDRHTREIALVLVGTLSCLTCLTGCQEQTPAAATSKIAAAEAVYAASLHPRDDRVVLAGHVFAPPPLPTVDRPIEPSNLDDDNGAESLIRVAPEVRDNFSARTQPRRLPPVDATQIPGPGRRPSPAQSLAGELPPPPVAGEDNGLGYRFPRSTTTIRRLPAVAEAIDSEANYPSDSSPAEMELPADQAGVVWPADAAPVTADLGPRLDSKAEPQASTFPIQEDPEGDADERWAPAPTVTRLKENAKLPPSGMRRLPPVEASVSSDGQPSQPRSLGAPAFKAETDLLDRSDMKQREGQAPATPAFTPSPVDSVPPAPRRTLSPTPTNLPTEPMPIEPHVAQTGDGPHGNRWTPVELPVQPQPQRNRGSSREAPSASPVVTRQVTAIVHQANRLASRGALFAARAEMIKALRVATQASDTQLGTKAHSDALSHGMRAIEEAEDFAPRGSRLEAEIELKQVVTAHRTPVLKEESLDEMTPLQALQRYFTYAQEQLAEACLSVPATSEALYGLGRIYTVLDESTATSQELNIPKAMALHQAALIVQPQHHRAANELGVLLARYGQLEDARRVLLHSITLQPEPEAWHNLAVVHKRLGEMELAQRAQNEWQIALDQRKRQPQQQQSEPVRWVDAREFTAARPTPGP